MKVKTQLKAGGTYLKGSEVKGKNIGRLAAVAVSAAVTLGVVLLSSPSQPAKAQALAPAPVAAARTLTVRDHTRIVKLVMHRRADILAARSGLDTQSVEAALGEISRRTARRQQHGLLLSAQQALASSRALADVDPRAPQWRAAAPVVTRIANFDGGPRQLAAMLRARARRAHGSLRVTLGVAAQIATDGASTIYDPGYWVEEVIWDPRQIFGEASSLGIKLADKAKGVAKADAIGAVAGGASTATKSRDPRVIAGGAVGGAVSGSVKEVLE